MDLTTPEKQAEAAKLLQEAGTYFVDVEDAPEGDWFKRFFILDGAHMILTEEGWEHGSAKPQMAEDAKEQGFPLSEFILDEVNAPNP